MVRATHSKTKTIYIAFTILYFITIEEVYCDTDRQPDTESDALPDALPESPTSAFLWGRKVSEAYKERTKGIPEGNLSDIETVGVPFRRRALSVRRKSKAVAPWDRYVNLHEEVNPAINLAKATEFDICCLNITRDTLNHDPADFTSFVKSLLTTDKDLNDLAPQTQIFKALFYRDILLENTFSIIPPVTDCERADYAIRCIRDHKAYGFWHRYGNRSTEHVILKSHFTLVSSLRTQSNYDEQLYSQYFKRANIVREIFIKYLEKVDWNKVLAPTKFCSIKCKTQIKSVFKDCPTFFHCAKFAYKYLVKADMMGHHKTDENNHALNYMNYIYGNVKVYPKTPINDDKAKPRSIGSQMVMTPMNYCITVADGLFEIMPFDAIQWATRILACHDDMVEAGIDFDELKKRHSSILKAMEKLPKNEENDTDKGKIYMGEVTNYYLKKMTELNNGIITTGDTNQRYFEIVFFHISLTFIDRRSDAYDYVHNLIQYTNIGETPVDIPQHLSELKNPDRYCDELSQVPAEVPKVP